MNWIEGTLLIWPWAFWWEQQKVVTMCIWDNMSISCHYCVRVSWAQETDVDIHVHIRSGSRGGNPNFIYSVFLVCVFFFWGGGLYIFIEFLRNNFPWGEGGGVRGTVLIPYAHVCDVGCNKDGTTYQRKRIIVHTSSKGNKEGPLGGWPMHTPTPKNPHRPHSFGYNYIFRDFTLETQLF
jgi:hypothetical protein